MKRNKERNGWALWDVGGYHLSLNGNMQLKLGLLDDGGLEIETANSMNMDGMQGTQEGPHEKSDCRKRILGAFTT